MKTQKFLFLIIIALTTISVKSQIKVNSAGHIGIGASGISNYKTYIYNPSTINNARGLSVKLEQPAQGYYKQYSILGSITSGKGYTFGVYGYAYNTTVTNYGRSYGVFGKAGNGAGGYNYGVYGWLYGSNNGAAIFGTVYPLGDVNTMGKYAGYFRGDVHVEDELWADEVTESDIRIKENIIDIDNSLDNILKIKGQKYKLKLPNEIFQETGDSDTIDNETFDYSKLQKYQKDHYGIIAQELQEVFPDLVYKSPKGLLGIDYEGLIPIIIEAIKEQQAQIETLKAEIETLKINNSKTKSTAGNDLNHNSVLLQNQPNPFSENTYINYFIPDEVNKAVIYIYNLQGRQVKVIDINERGNGSAVIYGSELYAGTYHYTLITDGRIVGTYTMILTD
jgi:hypothetical protein